MGYCGFGGEFVLGEVAFEGEGGHLETLGFRWDVDWADFLRVYLCF